MAFHWTFVIIQHYPFLKKYKYFKTNIENKSFWCNKLHSLLRIFSLLKRKGLHPKNNRNINVEQSLEEKKSECKPLFQIRSEKQKQHIMYLIHTHFSTSNSVLKLYLRFNRRLPELNTVLFCLSSYPVFLTCEQLLSSMSPPTLWYYSCESERFCQYNYA